MEKKMFKPNEKGICKWRDIGIVLISVLVVSLLAGTMATAMWAMDARGAELMKIQDTVVAANSGDITSKDFAAKSTAPEKERNRTFDKANNDFSPLLTAELDKIEVKRGESVNVSGEASGTDVVDIVVMGPRGLRRMPDFIASEIALADGIRFMTVEVAENNTFKAEIRIPEEIYSGFHYVMVLSPGEDGVYGVTNKTSGELFDAMLDYISSKGGCEDVLPGKSTEQLRDIIAAATFNATDSDDLAADLTFVGALSFGEVIKLNPIASVHVGEPLMVNGTAELENDSVVVLSVISGPTDFPGCCCHVENGMFQCTLDTTDAVPGTYVMQAEDKEGNIDTVPFELLVTVPSAAIQTLNKTVKTEVIGAKGEKVVFDMPHYVVIGETWAVKGTTTASGDLDIVIDDILMADDFPIDSWGEFEWEWNTKNPLPHMGAYTTGPCFIKAYLNCHVAGVSVGDYVRTEYKYIDPEGVNVLWLVSPDVYGELSWNGIAGGDNLSVQGATLGTNTVDIVIIGPKGLKELPDSFTSEDAIVEGLYFTSAEVDVDGTFEIEIEVPEEADSGIYNLIVFIPGRDSLYALTTREEGGCSMRYWIMDGGRTISLVATNRRSWQCLKKQPIALLAVMTSLRVSRLLSEGNQSTTSTRERTSPRFRMR